MDVLDTDLPAVKLVRPRVHGDARGQLTEIFRAERFAQAGLPARFVQDNLSRSADAGTVRGLHYQIGAHVQGKLVMALTGAILDVALDLRRSAATFGHHAAVTLTADRWEALWVPEGFAHGFCTTAPGTTVLYKLTAPFAPDSERGVAWDDPALGIAWPVAPEAAILSDRDRRWPRLADAAPADLF
jgi:dTDP-4-dehydrorhamnose 3,5-epimerase